MSKVIKIASQLQDLMDRVNALERSDNVTRKIMLKRTQRRFKELKKEFDLIGRISLFRVTTSKGVVYLGNLQKTDLYDVIHYMDPDAKILGITPLETKTFMVLSGEKTP